MALHPPSPHSGFRFGRRPRKNHSRWRPQKTNGSAGDPKKSEVAHAALFWLVGKLEDKICFVQLLVKRYVWIHEQPFIIDEYSDQGMKSPRCRLPIVLGWKSNCLAILALVPPAVSRVRISIRFSLVLWWWDIARPPAYCLLLKLFYRNRRCLYWYSVAFWVGLGVLCLQFHTNLC